MAGQNENSGGAHSEMAAIAFTILTVIILVLMWNFWRAPIVTVFYAMDLPQLFIRKHTVGLSETGEEYYQYLLSFFDGRDLPGRVPIGELWMVSERVGENSRIVISALIAGMAAIIFFKMKGDGLKTKLSLKGLMAYQAKHWKTVAPSVSFNPDVEDENTAPAKTPAEWMHDLGLKIKTSNQGILPEDIREVCVREFARQLGPGWMPVARLKTHQRVLFAFFLSHARSEKTGYALRKEVANVYAFTTDAKKRDAIVEELIKPHISNTKDEVYQEFIKLAEKHAYISTAFHRLLKESRNKSGVLPSAEFTWLKKIDRDLWYAMNNVGRDVSHTEAAGVLSHFNYERIARRAYAEPKVDEAIMGLEQYLTFHQVEDPDDFQLAN